MQLLERHDSALGNLRQLAARGKAPRLLHQTGWSLSDKPLRCQVSRINSRACGHPLVHRRDRPAVRTSPAGKIVCTAFSPLLAELRPVPVVKISPAVIQLSKRVTPGSVVEFGGFFRRSFALLRIPLELQSLRPSRVRVTQPVPPIFGGNSRRAFLLAIRPLIRATQRGHDATSWRTRRAFFVPPAHRSHSLSLPVMHQVRDLQPNKLTTGCGGLFVCVCDSRSSTI